MERRLMSETDTGGLLTIAQIEARNRAQAAARNRTQTNFLRDGGTYAAILQQKYESGEIDAEYVYREYPKMLRISKGVQEIKCETEVLRGNTTAMREWTETREVFDQILVYDEAEEERVLQGGRTSAEVEADRAQLIAQARARGLKIDPSWTMVRLQRELGTHQVSDTVVQLQRQVEELEEKAALRRRIADLEAQIAGKAAPAPVGDEEVAQLRASLKEYGLHVDMRWGLQRLRDEMERVTQPDGATADAGNVKLGAGMLRY
jgi:hypothetical protein